MALTPMQVMKRGSGGGGGIGSVIGGTLGAIGGGIAAAATGGLALPAVGAGLSIGSTAGGMVGGAVAPGKSGQQTVANQSAIARRMEAPEPSQILEQSLAALKETTPDIQEAYGAPLMKAYELSLGKRQRGMA